MRLDGRALAPLYVALAAFALALATPPGDPDTYWHLASGKWMLDHGALLRTDVFSSTVNGQPYSVGEWFGEIVLYVAYLAGGWTGLVVLRALLVAVAAFFLTRVALRGGTPVIIAVPVSCAALLLSEIVWTDRPHLFTLALFPLLLDLLLTARGGRLGVLLGVPPLLLVWTNLHGGYALGLALVGIFTLDALLERRNWASSAFAITAITAFAASLVDPGSLGLGAAAAHATAPPRFIVEESPPDVTRPAGFVFAAFIIGTLALALRAGGTLLDLMLLAPLLWLGLSAQRQMPYFAFAAVPYITTALPRAWSPLEAWLARRRPYPRAAVVGFGAGVVAMALVGLALVPSAPNERAYPTAALAAVRSSSGVLLNEYDWGGYLIWRAPERPVFVDGRLFPFLPDVFADWREAVELGPHWKDVLDRYKVAQVLLRPDRALVSALRDQGWRVLSEDAVAVLLERPR
ncbi:MAG: hypothetical protein E6J35_04595 [Chloroflexi bacterium]|nr:MAG: hypothetical protein E6J35_04595 [Chloroflexota bacterium]